jgi:hypothetical protein
VCAQGRAGNDKAEDNRSASAADDPSHAILPNAVSDGQPCRYNTVSVRE